LNKKLKTIRTRHVSRRAIERYGVHLTKRDQERIIGKIQRRDEGVRFLFKQSNSRSHYEIDYQGETFRVVYNKVHKCILTVLPTKNQA